MVLDPKQLIQYAIRKQNKIAHVPCQTLVFGVDEIPAGILAKIEKDYSKDFLDDADYVAFTRGKIDKDMVEKIFKATDKALGEDANKLVVGDFKELKIDAAESTSAEDEADDVDADEASDEEVTAIVNDNTEDSNEDAVEDALDNEIAESLNETEYFKVDDEYIKTADEGLQELKAANKDAYDLAMKYLNSKKGTTLVVSAADFAKGRTERALAPKEEKAPEAPTKTPEEVRADAIKAAAEKWKRDREAEAAEKARQKIKSIWIKEIHIDDDNESKSVAKLEITFMDGKVVDEDFPIGTTGLDSNFKDITVGGRKVSGERYRQGDAFYKEVYKNLKPAFARYGIEPSDEDVRISMVRTSFNDWRIKWYYGKDKKTEPMFAFSRTEADAKAEAMAKDASKRAISRLELLADPSKKNAASSAAAGKGRVVYKNGNTTIYNPNEAEDNSVAAVVHQGKSIAQWEKEFKGEFSQTQLLRFARSGTDLQKLLLTVNGICTLDEAKESGEKKDENAQGDEAQESSAPTRWVFLKITMKK